MQAMIAKIRDSLQGAISVTVFFTTFSATRLFLYFLQTLEKQRQKSLIFCVFKGFRKRLVA